jgi:hypothetical protein
MQRIDKHKFLVSGNDMLESKGLARRLLDAQKQGLRLSHCSMTTRLGGGL